MSSRGRCRIGVPAADALRLIVIDDDDEVDEAESGTRASADQRFVEQERPDPTPCVPDLGQAVRPTPEHRDHLPQRQVAGHPREVLVGRDGHVAEQARRLVRGRP